MQDFFKIFTLIITWKVLFCAIVVKWVKKAKSLLKTKGKLYIVHRPDRLDDLFKTLEEYQGSQKTFSIENFMPINQTKNG